MYWDIDLDTNRQVQVVPRTHPDHSRGASGGHGDLRGGVVVDHRGHHVMDRAQGKIINLINHYIYQSASLSVSLCVCVFGCSLTPPKRRIPAT